MTHRLYYLDAEVRAFDAVVQSVAEVGGRLHVVLDRTAFYPTSGGQPFDTGRLGAASVVEVIDLDNGDIAHVVTSPLEPGQSVHGEIDWPRRIDHAQQHTGQHILSAAFDRLSDAHTVSFHLGAESSTIDLSREVTSGEIDAAEAEANRVVWDDRPVHVRMLTAETARTLPLRKPPAREGELRVVEVEAFDWSACGGTHVARTGMIGIIAITGWERFKGGVRITFVCGDRALRSHRSLRDVVTALTRAASAPAGELVSLVGRLQQAGRDADRTIQSLRQELAIFRGAELRQAGETIGRHRVVLRHIDGDAAELKALAQATVSRSDLAAIFVGSGQPAPVVVVSAQGSTVDAAVLIKAATSALGGRGGGRPEQAQAGVTAGADVIVTFLRQQLES